MSRTGRRLLLYTCGVLLGGTGLWFAYGHTVAPDPAVRLNGAALIGGLGDYDRALEIVDQVLAEHQDNVEARVYRATFLAAAGRTAEAIDAFDDAIRHVDRGELRLSLIQDRAGVLLEAGRLQEFDRVRDKLAAAGEDQRVSVLDGLAAAKRGDWTAAIDAYQEARKHTPDEERLKARLWNATMARGNAAVGAGRFADAQADFDVASKLFPKAEQAHLKAAEVRLVRGDLDGAIRILGTVQRSLPGVAPLLFRLATALLENEREGDALEVLEVAFEVDQNGTRARFRQESAWDSYRDHPMVKKSRGTGLTGSE